MCYNAPDPTPAGETAAAQVSQNIGTAIANSFMNNVNQSGPDGTKSYNVSDYYTYVDKSDPNKPITYQVPIWNQTETLSPQQQLIKDQQDQTKLGLSTLANNQTNFLQNYMDKPFSYDVGDHEKWASGLYDKLNSPREQQQMSSLQTQLANSGIKLGSDAYDRAMQSQSKSIEDARNQFELNSYQQGFGNAQATRNQPINEITALMSGGQVSMPQFGQTNSYTIPTVDHAGIIANYDQQRIANAQAEYAAKSGIMGGLFSMGGALLSDKRAKKDITKIGEAEIEGDDGQEHETGLYAYRYKGEPKSKPKHKGVMAQNIAKVKPSAVSRTPSGLMAVHYDRLKRA